MHRRHSLIVNLGILKTGRFGSVHLDMLRSAYWVVPDVPCVRAEGRVAVEPLKVERREDDGREKGMGTGSGAGRFSQWHG